MALDENDLTIRSRHGLLRDLVPIYSYSQLAPNLVAVGLIFWLSLFLGHFPLALLPVIMLGWVLQFASRPSLMTISNAQAEWLEGIVEEQGFYGWSEVDGGWRLLDKPWWQRLPHLFVKFLPGEPATVIAPRDVMESMRTALELVEEHEILIPQGDQPLAFQPDEPEPLPWHMKIPAWGLITACVVAWVWQVISQSVGGTPDWGLSGAALGQRRFETIFLHIFAHGGAMHLAMNMTMLAAIGPPLTARLGPPPLSWLRFFLLFLFSGLAGAALYLLVHPAGTVPMIGASGALYGLLGLLIRAPADGQAVLSVKSRRIRRVGWVLVKQNVFLFVLLAMMAWSNGTAGGLAWEAHLGGFLFGLLVGPQLLPRASGARPNPKTIPELSSEPVASAD